MTHERRYIRHVPVKLWQRAKILAVSRQWTLSKLVVEAIWDYLERANREE